MKHFFYLVSLLIISTGVSAQINWYGAVHSNTGSTGRTSVSSIETYKDGSTLVAGKFATNTEDPAAATFLDAQFTGAPFKTTMQQTNGNAYVAKVGKDGKTIWVINTDRGNISDAFAVSTEDGGALVALWGTYTQKNALGDNKVLRFMNGTKTLIESVHEYKEYYATSTSKVPSPPKYGYIIKVSADGQNATITTEFQQTDTIVHGFSIREFVKTNDANLLAVQVSKPILVNNDTVVPVEGGVYEPPFEGEPFVFEINDEGKVISKGCARQKELKSSQFRLTTGAPDRYYSAINVVKEENSKQQNILINSFNRSTGALIASDTIFGVYKNPGRFQVKDILVKDNFAYIAGGTYSGGFALDNDTVNYDIPVFNGYVVKYDLINHKTTNAYIHRAAGIGLSTHLVTINDTLYAYLYDWGSKEPRILLQGLDEDLKPTRKIGLINSTGMAVTTDAKFDGENFIYSINAPKGIAYSFNSNPDIQFKDPIILGFIASVKLTTHGITTISNNITTNGDETRKVIRNGQVFIIKGNEIYNIFGQKL